MIFNDKEIEFPAILQLSFYKVIETLEKQAEDKDLARATFAKELIKEVDKFPELRDGIEDFQNLNKYEASIQKLSRTLFPDALLDNELKALTPPFNFNPLYTSRRFDNMVKASDGTFSFMMKNVDEDLLYIYSCNFILGSYYGFKPIGSTPHLLEVFNKDQGIFRVYKLLINVDMCEFVPTNKATDITQKDYEELMNDFGNLALWKQKFPPNSWIMRGINMTSMVDVTAEQSINTITSNLLVRSTDTFEKIQSGMRNMLNISNLELGLISFRNNMLVRGEAKQMNSIILQPDETLVCNDEMCDMTFGTLMNKKEAVVIIDTDEFDNQSQTDFSARIKKSGFKSYIITPLIHEGETLGFIELGAAKRYDLNKSTLVILENIMPILAMAKKRFMTEAQNEIEAIIQQECTTIHPSVKWRFEEEAEKFLHKQLSGEQPIFKDITFNNLYPLYGQMDIKGSSERRNQAVSKDLLKQLNAVSKILKNAYKKTDMLAIEELLFRLNSFRSDIQLELSAGSEHSILAFLKTDVYPLFKHLSVKYGDLKLLIEEYNALLDPDLKTIYEARKAYDTSVNQINQRLASFLDKRQVEAQAIFPHYFERYKTDGVEFNIYIGDSIVSNEVFDPIYLKNLRVWQLLTMCEMEKEFKTIQKELDTPIEMASLILVYNTAISVHFRMDEKQFDVEGAYNARYEIIKKRVDKAHIKGTSERITRPGSIAIVYSQDQDANEYRVYLQFLASKGLIKETIEDVELEDLQGVHGLHALRVDLNYEGEMNVDDLLLEIEKKSVRNA